MQIFTRIFLGMVLFTLACALGAYAKETKTQKIVSASMVESATSTAQEISAAVTAANPVSPEKALSPVALVPATEPVAMPPALPTPKTTFDNLQTAYDGESNAHVRYLAFAKKADAEGYGRAANLFKAAAQAEQIHLERHAKIITKMGGTPKANIQTPDVKTTAKNIKAAFKGETYESTVMYPEFLALAKKENNEDAIDAFEDAGAAETVHAMLYKQAFEQLPVWKQRSKEFYVCSICGNVEEKLNFAECAICGTAKEKFLKIK